MEILAEIFGGFGYLTYASEQLRIEFKLPTLVGLAPDRPCSLWTSYQGCKMRKITQLIAIFKREK